MEKEKENLEVEKWNFRVIKEGGEYSIRDVFYNKEGEIIGWGGDCEKAIGDTLEELKQAVSYYMPALVKPVVEVEGDELIGEID